jgi:hypothetical protein
VFKLGKQFPVTTLQQKHIQSQLSWHDSHLKSMAEKLTGGVVELL